jgi:hypothetical protein
MRVRIKPRGNSSLYLAARRGTDPVLIKPFCSSSHQPSCVACIPCIHTTAASIASKSPGPVSRWRLRRNIAPIASRDIAERLLEAAAVIGRGKSAIKLAKCCLRPVPGCATSLHFIKSAVVPAALTGGACPPASGRGEAPGQQHQQAGLHDPRQEFGCEQGVHGKPVLAENRRHLGATAATTNLCNCCSTYRPYIGTGRSPRQTKHDSPS